MKNKYFWFKLPVNFFDKDEIKILSSYDNGYMQVYIYLYLITKSIKTDGLLKVYDQPITSKMLAVLMGNPGIEDLIDQTINNLLSLGLIKREKNHVLKIIKIEEMIGSETIWADYKRKERKSKLDNVKDMSNNSPIEKEKEKEKKKEKELIDNDPLNNYLDNLYKNMR